jgi:type VI protein secretion system component VasK
VDALLQRLAVLARLEALTMRMHARRAARTGVIVAAAFAAASFAIGLLNLAAFDALDTSFGRTTAALVLAAGNGLIAIVIALAARRRAPTAEEAMLEQLRALTLAELGTDVAQLKTQLGHLQQQASHVRELIARATNADPWQLSLASVGPILSLASRMLHKNKSA